MAIPQPVVHGTTIYVSIVAAMSIMTLFARCLGVCACGVGKSGRAAWDRRGFFAA